MRKFPGEPPESPLRWLLSAVVIVAAILAAYLEPTKIWFISAGVSVVALAGCVAWGSLRRSSSFDANVDDEAKRRLAWRWIYFAVVADATAVLTIPGLKNLPPAVVVPGALVLIVGIMWAGARFGRSFDEPARASVQTEPPKIFRSLTIGDTIELLTWTCSYAVIAIAQESFWH